MDSVKGPGPNRFRDRFPLVTHLLGTACTEGTDGGGPAAAVRPFNVGPVVLVVQFFYLLRDQIKTDLKVNENARAARPASPIVRRELILSNRG